MQLIETFQHKGCTVEIHHDESGADSPREWDTFGTFWTQERNSRSPDKLPVSGNIFRSLSDLFGADPDSGSFSTKGLDAGAIWLPVWKYEHSGSVYAAAESNPFSCPWDSGQAGVIFAIKEKVRKEFGAKRITAKIRAKALENLKQEVKTYSQWVNGEVYGYVINDASGAEIDSCWGFIGDLEYVKEEAKRALTNH